MKISIYNVHDKPIGRGGMGQVYSGTDPNGNRVAIKEMLAQYVSDPHLCQRFHQEVKILSQLEHQFIVKMYALFEDCGNLYLVMEYVEGETIEQYVKRRGVLSEREAVLLFVDILSALEYAHEKGYVHRDIKPNNIMIRPGGSPCLLDFGIAKDMKRTSSGSGLTTTFGMTIGTVGYMSPEQAEGLSIDHRSDIYSLGCVLFYMLTGQHAVKEESNDIKTRIAIISKPFPKALDFNASLSKDIQRILDMATAKDMTKRFRSCAEFKTHLSKLIKEPDNGSPNSLQEQLNTVQKQLKTVEKSRRKNKTAWIVLLIFGLLLNFVLFGVIGGLSEDLDYKDTKISSLNRNLDEKNKKVSSLEKEISALTTENSKLKDQSPILYKTTSKVDYYYVERCYESYKKTNCYSNPDYLLKVYMTKNGYGLTEYGWLKMSNLKKYQ
ncbi:MAG: protein kinase [Prevotellaceae bacterium]|jgi:serine/threonine protein kinase|nr:protein kinase [Prevotellaceae bacterium]